MTQDEQLMCLQHLLENLPESIPYHDLGLTSYTFSVADDNIEKYGDETSTTNHRLEVIFGSCHSTGGVVLIQE